MEYPCNAVFLSHYTVDKCEKDGKPISNLQLQKMMYFLQSVYCRATKGNLLFKDPFEAWPYGPVLPEVYSEFSKYGGRLIHEQYNDNLWLPFSVEKFINEGISILREKTPWDLVKTSHAPGSPWDIVWNGGLGFKKEIPNELIINAAITGLNIE